jgi:hypothetical protein
LSLDRRAAALRLCKLHTHKDLLDGKGDKHKQRAFPVLPNQRLREPHDPYCEQ